MKQAGLGIIIKDKKILLAQRSDTCKYFPLHWCIPGGKTEHNESPKHTTIREVKEELNIDFHAKELFHSEIRHGYELYYYLGKGEGSIILQESEISDSKEFSFEELHDQKLAFNHREILHLLHQKNLL